MKQLLLTAFILATITAGAQTLVKDIYPGAGNGFPTSFVTLGNYTYFVASDSTHGFELWKTDGTTNGTVMIKDVAPGTDNGLAEDEDGLVFSQFTIMNNELYFFANDDSTGFELWKSDGTEAGTVQVKDIYAGDTGSVTLGQQIVVMNNELYFAAWDTNQNSQLWKSDGTTGGTTVVKDLAPRGLNPSGFFVNGNTMYFTADSNFTGNALWKTDGTANGTVMVKDADSIGYNDYYTNFTLFNNKVYFTTYETVHGEELWTTDGTTAGTHIAVDIAPGPFGSNPQYIVVFNNKMIFTAGTLAHGDELWSSDGTPGGTTEIKDIDTIAGMGSGPAVETVWGDKIFFQANDGIHGNELWSSNGTANGTQLVKDINTTTTTYPGSYPSDLIVINNVLYFDADDSIHGRELYQSDGTAGGTFMLSDLRVGSDGSYPSGLTQLNNMVLFEANDFVIGAELYRLGEPLAVNEVGEAINFRVQPNPAKDYVTIMVDGNAIGGTLQLLDITGREISNNPFDASIYQMNTSSLRAGLYLLKLTNKKGEVGVKKVVIE